MLTYYELDLGLNHVIRKWSDETDRNANMLIPGASRFICCTHRQPSHCHVVFAAVPGVPDGPGGVLVLAENWVIYRRPVSCLVVWLSGCLVVWSRIVCG